MCAAKSDATAGMRRLTAAAELSTRTANPTEYSSTGALAKKKIAHVKDVLGMSGELHDVPLLPWVPGTAHDPPPR